MKDYLPKRVYFEPQALNYPLGEKIYQQMKDKKVSISMTTSHNRVTGIPGSTAEEAYREGKDTLVVGVRKGKDFATCKPSAHYQLPLVTGCPSKCEYCYLNTTMGKKPYIRVYVNIDEILAKTAEYIKERKPESTLFEGAATSDPLPVEGLTGSLAKTIDFFSQEEYAAFRFVTKYTMVDNLLHLEHNNKTTVRFSINSNRIIQKYEHGTPPLKERILAAQKVSNAGYPLGFIIGPIFWYEGWEKEYSEMLQQLADSLKDKKADFELITHRYTNRAKENILSIFPESSLPMQETERKFKYGQFGYGKYIYPAEKMELLKNFFTANLNKLFPTSEIKYFV